MRCVSEGSPGPRSGLVGQFLAHQAHGYIRPASGGADISNSCEQAGARCRGLVCQPALGRQTQVPATHPRLHLFTIFEADLRAATLRATHDLVTGLTERELRREGPAAIHVR